MTAAPSSTRRLSGGRARRGRPGRRTYVLDTSVLLADPLAGRRFAEHEVVVPVTVLVELEGKRHHPDLGWSAREALRDLERLRLDHGTLTEPMPVNSEGGTLRIEINHRDPSGLPAGLVSGDNDRRILAVAKNLDDGIRDVVVVSKDLPMRLLAGAAGLNAEEYRNEQVSETGWNGFVEIEVAAEDVDLIYDERVLDLPEARDLPCNAGVSLHAGSQSALARLGSDKRLHLVRGDREAFGVRGRSAEQRVALDMLLDPSIEIVSIGGSAGTGKTVLSLGAGLELVMEQRMHKRVVVLRPVFAVGGQDLGYLPGSEAEKMAPWSGAVWDALEAIAGPNVRDELLDRRMLEVLPLTHLRGRTLTDSFVIIDEAQNLERPVLLTALSRMGRGTRVVLTHDVAQRDNLRVGRYDGIASVVETLRGHPIFGHVTLTRSERSEIAALVTGLLDGPPLL